MEPISCQKEKRFFILGSAAAILFLAGILAVVLLLPPRLPEKKPVEYSSGEDGVRGQLFTVGLPAGCKMEVL